MSLKNNFSDSFMHWLNTFLEEKEIDPECTVFEFTNDNGIYNYMPLGTVIEFIAQLNEEEQEQIRATLVKIDFLNGDVNHFFEYLAKGISMTNPLF